MLGSTGNVGRKLTVEFAIKGINVIVPIRAKTTKDARERVLKMLESDNKDTMNSLMSKIDIMAIDDI